MKKSQSRSWKKGLKSVSLRFWVWSHTVIHTKLKYTANVVKLSGHIQNPQNAPNWEQVPQAGAPYLQLISRSPLLLAFLHSALIISGAVHYSASGAFAFLHWVSRCAAASYLERVSALPVAVNMHCLAPPTRDAPPQLPTITANPQTVAS